MAKKFLEEFYGNETLESMIIKDSISMRDIYNNLTKGEAYLKNNGIQISWNFGFYFNISLNNIIIPNNLKEPIKVIFNENKKIDIISMRHIKSLCSKYKYKNPNINCKTCKKEFTIEMKYLLSHQKHSLFIFEKYITIPENDFNNYFKNQEDLDKKFETPLKFDKNFDSYIKNYYVYEKKYFIFYKDNERNEMAIELYEGDNFVEKLTIYFGQPGLGKTILTIAVSKYMINHFVIGTLYLNMKCFKKCFDNNEFIKCKKILYDEIPYLFQGEYTQYLKCLNLVYNFNIFNLNSLWELISIIIKFISDENKKNKDSIKKYIIFFDQYNEKLDEKKKLLKLYNEYIDITNPFIKSIFGFITLSSMNNTDIKEYKIDLIKNIFGYYKNTEYSKYQKELSKIINIQKFKFNNDLADDYFYLLGRTIKNYNILEYYIINKLNIEDLIKNERAHIENNLKIFYNYNDNKTNLIKILYFSTKKKYTINEFIDIVKYVPFKYFIPQIKQDKKSKLKYIQIKYAYPLVEEVIIELFELLINQELKLYNSLNIYQKLHGGARGLLFESLVIYHLNPTIKINEKKNIIKFDDININMVKEMRKFIPRKNEKIKERNEKIHLEKGTYLFIQKIINGKALDSLIVIIDDDNSATIIGIKISFHKKNSQIYTQSKLIKILKTLKKNLSKIYDFSISLKNIYFTYIFDLQYQNDYFDEYTLMLNNCKDKGMPYMQFDSEKYIMYDKKGKIVKNIKDNIYCPYKNEDDKKIDIEKENLEKEEVDEILEEEEEDDEVFEEKENKVLEEEEQKEEIKYEYLINIEKKDELVPFYDIKNKGKKALFSNPSYIPNNPLKIEENNLIIQILREDYKYGNSINFLNFIGFEYMTSREQFHEDIIYISKIRESSEKLMIYFSKKQKKMIPKIISSANSVSTFKNNISYLYDKYIIFPNEISN